MTDPHVNNPKSPKYYVSRYLQSIKNDLRGKIVLDVAAGSGTTTGILLDLGARVEAFDLFPEYFMQKDVLCKRADILDHIPVDDSYADYVICQEGLEHFSDQVKAYKEFNRVLKPGGRLIITTPSYSNLKAKLSYLLFETEDMNKLMPPNEIDSVWMGQRSLNNEIYYGHIFLSGIQKLRVIGRLTGFTIDDVLFMRYNKTSLVLLPFFYPFILASSLYTYYKALRKDRPTNKDVKKEVYKEQLRMNISIKTLAGAHTFLVYRKEGEPGHLPAVNGSTKPFNKVM